MWTWFHQLASPPTFYRFAEVLAPWLLGIAILLIGAGVYAGLFLAPPDYQQGDAFRIIYIHVPFAMTCGTGFFVSVVASIAYLWIVQLSSMVRL